MSSSALRDPGVGRGCTGASSGLPVVSPWEPLVSLLLCVACFCFVLFNGQDLLHHFSEEGMITGQNQSTVDP